MNAEELKSYLASRGKAVEDGLEYLLNQIQGSGRLLDAMRHSTMAGGKRVRPVLLMAAADAVGADGLSFLHPACALEFIHTFSLVHDDLPALDNDMLRRGQATCHARFDEATAILAGDALQTYAFEVLLGPGRPRGVPPERWLDVVWRIARAVGVHGMTEGQMRDILGETQDLSLEELEALHRLKTGALIEASVQAGALLGGGTENQVAALLKYAGNIGLAFQVADDILNVEGDPALLGKAVGTDLGRGKTTYPGLMGLDGARRFAESLVDGALRAIEGFDGKSDPLRGLARYIVSRKK
jgi:geranylgeranyl diphosphate synthase type II